MGFLGTFSTWIEELIRSLLISSISLIDDNDNATAAAISEGLNWRNSASTNPGNSHVRIKLFMINKSPNSLCLIFKIFVELTFYCDQNEMLKLQE